MTDLRQHLLEGGVIPALPLALDSSRRLSPDHQRAIIRYYVAAGCSGIAAAVHSTQFAIRSPEHNLLRPVLELASEAIDEALLRAPRNFVKIAGVCGHTNQALEEARLCRSLGYHAALVSMAAWKTGSEAEILDHCRRVAEIIPIIGFQLQTAVGGREFSVSFWEQFVRIDNLVAIKVAPFNRFQTLDVVRALAGSGRTDVALYTGNDDNIVVDLLTPFSFGTGDGARRLWFSGGLLGHWGVWTHAAVALFQRIMKERGLSALDPSLLTTAAQVTDMNAALFDPAHGFSGCIPGILEVLRRQGLVPTNLCLDPSEVLSPGQAEELDRVCAAYPHLTDDGFIAEHLASWRSG
ncbi:dihydrodipicolinate synthase family protein [Luteolibacter sp. SL250]|nr:dihydrodipicolinate synthase family protein [Luteolibacter sp. SL250]WAC19102.1 dihydrodipicolinate synthase family protein [Luteolibacter sp. SL250]